MYRAGEVKHTAGQEMRRFALSVVRTGPSLYLSFEQALALALALADYHTLSLSLSLCKQDKKCGATLYLSYLDYVAASAVLKQGDGLGTGSKTSCCSSSSISSFYAQLLTSSPAGQNLRVSFSCFRDQIS